MKVLLITHTPPCDNHPDGPSVNRLCEDVLGQNAEICIFSVQDCEFTANIPQEYIRNMSIDFYETPKSAWGRRACAKKIAEFAAWQYPTLIWTTAAINSKLLRQVEKLTGLPVTAQNISGGNFRTDLTSPLTGGQS
jgi:hypothetical protein